MADQSDERDRIDRWLASTGFPLEYATVRTLEATGFSADAGLYYRPDGGGLPREVDVVARTDGPYDRPPVTVRLMLECKYAVAPWIVLTREAWAPVTPENLLEWTTATQGARESLIARAKTTGRRGVPNWLHSTPQQHGVNIIELPPPSKVSGSGRERPYEAMTQLVDAAQGILSEVPPIERTTAYGSQTEPPLAVAWPALVVRGRLYQAKLADDGQLKSEPIEWQRVIWGGSTGKPTVFDVVSEAYLGAYGQMALDGMRAIEAALHG